jgi:hypothetical protein
VQLVPIANKIVSSDPANGEVCSIQLYVIQFISDLRRVGGFPMVLLFPPRTKQTQQVKPKRLEYRQNKNKNKTKTVNRNQKD